MPKIIKCTLPNASELISGVRFEAAPDGMYSEPVADDVAEVFSSIPGYEIVEPKPAKLSKAEQKAAEEAAAAAAAAEAAAAAQQPQA